MPAILPCMSIQIFGTRKGQETRKADRFFRERGVSFQLIDLANRQRNGGSTTKIPPAAPSCRPSARIRTLSCDVFEESAHDVFGGAADDKP